MERAVFDRMAELDQTHWWYVARRRILASVIERKIVLPTHARILEIGCGTGHNFGMLGEFGTVDGIEIDAPARAIAAARLGRKISAASLPELTGIADGSYDLIALLDVLEHIEGDEAALTSIRRKLKPGGRILITVPANRWMWSAHDRVHHHFRRYAPSTLRAVIAAAGLKVEMLSYFNTVLFPLAALVRIAGKIVGREEGDDAQPPAPLNTAFTALFGIESHLVGRVSMPFGVSLLTILS
jgi:SAM-dependent methyltransferase